MYSQVSDKAGLQNLAILNRQPSEPSAKLLHKLHADVDPTTIALSFYNSLDSEPVQYSYAEIDNLSNCVAHELVTENICRQIIPVVLTQCPELYIAILGILKSGNAYCPVLPTESTERIEFICQEIKATVLFRSTDLPIQLDTSILQKTIPAWIQHSSRGEPVIGIAPRDLAYIMYTSGSTGLPKAVMISHEAAATSVLAHEEIFAGTQIGHRMLQFASPTFDISVFEIFSAWARGMTLVGAARKVLTTMLPDLINQARVNYMELTPSVAGLLPDQSDHRMQSVRVLITIGEMLTKKVIIGWHGKLYNAYGPTEATLHVSYVAVNSAEFDPSNIGKPLASCQLAILDPTSTTVLETGRVGELCIAGPQISRGYLRRDSLTRTSFITHELFDGSLYRSGDLALIQDGQVFFHGRKSGDSQVKFHGQRIELGEIEHKLLDDPNIEDCAVIYHDNRFYAFVVLSGSFEAVNKHYSLSRKLPFDIQPTVILQESIPVSSAGKRDLRRLREIANHNEQEIVEDSTESEQAQMTSNERAVVEAVQSVLGTSIRLGQSLNRLGLDSLGAIKIVMILRERDLSIEVHNVLRSKDVTELAKACIPLAPEHEEMADTSHGMSASRFDSLESIYGEHCSYSACSQIQNSMLAATLSDETGRLYCNHVWLELQGTTSHREFSDAWNKVVEIHEILRTGFHMTNDGPASTADFIQIVQPKSISAQHEIPLSIGDIKLLMNEHKSMCLLSSDNLYKPPIDIRCFRAATSTNLCISIMIHHALYDAWTLELLVRDLNQLLKIKSTMSRPSFREVASVLHRSHPSSRRTKDFWGTYLKDWSTPQFPVLAQEHIRSKNKLRSSRTCHFKWSWLEHSCQSLGVNPQTLGQLAWAMFLSWAAGESYPTMAITTSGRAFPVKDLRKTAGPFITTFPFRLDCAATSSVKETLHKINDHNLMLTSNNLAYREILKCSSVRQSPDTLFIYQKSADMLSPESDDRLIMVQEEDRLEFAVVLTFEKGLQSLVIHIDADENLISSGAAQMLTAQIEELLVSMLTTPSQSLQGLRQCSLELSSSINRKPMAAIHGRLDNIFENLSPTDRQRPALQFYDSMQSSQTLTYAELNSCANRLANSLKDAKLIPDEVVAICMDKCISMYASILAILKLGCAYVALDPQLPQDRLNIVLEMTKTKYIFTEHRYAHKFEDLHVVDAPLTLKKSGDTSFTSRPTQNLAYVLMTSGTTGTPKACAVTHSNVLSNCDALNEIYPHAPADRMMQFTSYTFDVSVFELFFTWKNRMCLVATRKDIMLSNITKVLQDFKITHLNMTPTAAALIRATDLPLIKCFITSGEASSGSIIEDWGNTKKYYNAYGPTETTNVCSARHIISSRTYPSALGLLLNNSSGYVLDERLQVLPRFAIGELFVGGAQVIRGYLGNEELTQASFIEHKDLGRLYRTGDLVRVLEDDSISIVGRVDSQVKVRGFRVELAEVNHVLRRQAGLIDCATILHESSLVSFVYMSAMTTSNTTNMTEELLTSLKSSLPDYMVPSFIVPLQKPIPLTTSFKLDTRVLSKQLQLYKANLTREDTFVEAESPSWSDESRSIAKVFSDISGIIPDQIRPDTSLFRLGLDSISAIRIAAYLRSQYHTEVRVSDILRLETPAALATIVSPQISESETPTTRDVKMSSNADYNQKKLFSTACERIAAIRHDILARLEIDDHDIEQILPCTPLQEGILLESQKGNNSNYSNQVVITLSAGLGTEQIRAACESLVQITPSLRTRFAFTKLRDLSCVQLIFKRGRLDWTTTSEDNVEGAVSEWTRATHRDDIQSSSLVRFLDIHNQQTHLLVVSMHHSVFDAWSLDLIYHDLDKLCQKEVVQTRPDTSIAIRSAYEGSGETQEQQTDWQQYLKAYEYITLPLLSRSTSTIQTSITVQLATPLDVLNDYAAKCSRPLLTLLHSAWALLLSQITGKQDTCFATVISGRTIGVDGIEQIATPMFNVLPIRVKVDPASNLSFVLENVHKGNLRHLAHPHYPLSKAIQAAQLGPAGQLFDTIVILQRPQSQNYSRSFENITDKGTSEYALMLEFIPLASSNTMTLRLVSGPGRIAIENLELIGKNLDYLLGSMKQHDLVIGTILDGLVNSFSALSSSPVRIESQELLHSSFVRHVHAQPEALAIDYLDNQGSRHHMTYAELGDRTAHLAGVLQSLNLLLGTPILVMMTDVPELFIAFLGILRAGLVYTPIASDVPIERLKMILHDLKPGRLLVDCTVDTPDLIASVCGVTIVDSRSISPQISACNKSGVSGRALIPSDLAYIIYTSGSTGVPKAVMLSHAAAVTTMSGAQPLLRLQRKSKWLQFASLTFDMSVFDMAIAFSAGICLCGAPKNMMLNDLSEVIQRLNITHLDLTPSVAKTLRQTNLPSVDLLFCIGESLTRDIIVAWDARCINVYGPTEAAMACTSVDISKTSIPQDIGRPFKHVQAGIFSAHDPVLLPILAIGELCLAGPQLCDGYLNDIVKTDSSFFEHKGVRFYRTGDLARMLADHSLSFVGRKDFQIKLRGQRIELEEINHAMKEVDEKLISVVTLPLSLQDQSTEQLVAFVTHTTKGFNDAEICKVLPTNESDNVQSLRRLRGIIPAYMIPSHVLLLNYIPLTSSGKVDRLSLSDLWINSQSKAPSTKVQSLSNFSDTELSIRRIFAKLSGTQETDIVRDSSMYSLGLDSISAMQITSMLKEIGFVVSVVEVLQNPALDKLAEFIDSHDAQVRTAKLGHVGRSAKFSKLCDALRERYNSSCVYYPCTPVQENMIAQFLKTRGESYYNHVLLKLNDEVDIDLLQTSWFDTIDRYDILRSGFVAVDEHDCQYALAVHSTTTTEQVWSHTIDVDDLMATIKSRIQQLRSELLQDILRPSLRLSIVHETKSRYLLFSAHHAIYDGFTLNHIFSQVRSSYRNEPFTLMDNLEQSQGKVWSIYHDNPFQQVPEEYWKTMMRQSSWTPFPNLNNTNSTQTDIQTERHIIKDLFNLEKLCRKLSVTMATATTVAWSKLLSAYTGEASVTFGIVLSGRTGSELGLASSPCVTTVPFACTLQGSSRTALLDAEDLSLQALQHQHAQLNKIAREDSSPLFDTLFVFQKDQALGYNELWHVVQDIAAVEVPISIEVSTSASNDHCVLELVYQGSRLPRVHAALLLSQYEEILRTILLTPETQILDLEESFSSELLSIMHPKVEAFEVPVKFVHEHVGFHAKKTPHSVALEFATDLDSIAKSWTYLEVDEISSRIANYLIDEHGLDTSAPIAICLDKSPEAFLTILAVLKTGSPFCCLDTSAPIERRRFIVSDCGAEAVVCAESDRAELMGAVDVNVITIPAWDHLTSSSKIPDINLDDHALCYILYTSGSTGTPKGCCLSHENVLQALSSFQTEFCGRFDTNSRFLAFASLHFDVSILETYFSWSIGARVCAAPRDALLSDIPGAIKKFGITHLDLTPQLAATLFPHEAESLLVFITGGEMLRKETIDNWGDTGVLFNFYGPTEATIGCTALKQVKKNARPSNIGQQWSNCGTIVTSRLGKSKPVLKGAIGVLNVGGLQVGAGYVGLPEATKQRFCYNKALESETYDTGDLVRLLAIDDSFDFIGRADSQIKLRGQRIETSEIDSVLLDSQDIKDAFTLVLKHPSQQNDHLISFVVPSKQYQMSDTRILNGKVDMTPQFEACKTMLPIYMIPTYIIPVTRIQLTPNNKVDIKKLGALYSSIEASNITDYAQNRSMRTYRAADRTIVASIKAALSDMIGMKMNDINDDASVFELGLDSISIVGLVRKLHNTGMKACSVATVMTALNINELAATLTVDEDESEQPLQMVSLQDLDEFKAAKMEAAASALAIESSSIEDILPCTPLMEGLLVESIQQGRDTHVNKFRFLANQIDHERLMAAFRELIGRTKILRSRFVLTSDGLIHVMLSTKSCQEHRHNDYPLKSDLIRLIKICEDDETFYELQLHHAIYDGHSLNIMLRQLQNLYDCKSSESLQPEPDFRTAVAYIMSQKLELSSDFWLEMLQNATILAPKRKTSEIMSSISTTTITTSQLEECAQHYKCSSNIIVQAAWSILMAQLLGGDSCFGLVVAGRNMPVEEVENTIYPMFNTIPIFVEISDTENVNELIRKLQTTFGSVIQHEHTPLRDIKKLLSMNSTKVLVDSLLVYQKQPSSQNLEVPTFTFQDDISQDSAGFSIALDITAIENGHITLSTTLHDIGINPSLFLKVYEQVLSALVMHDKLTDITTSISHIHRLEVIEHQIQSHRTRRATKDNLGAIQDTPELNKLKNVIAELLHISEDEVPVDDTFFMLGLDSIDVVKMSARLKQSHGLHVSVAEIMKNCSLRTLDHHLISKSRTTHNESKNHIPATFASEAASVLHIVEQYDTILPVSPMQGGMLTTMEILEDDVYMNHTLLRLLPNVDVGLLQEAWQSVISANDMLRTSFLEVGQHKLSFRCDYIQIVHSRHDTCIVLIDATNTDLQQIYATHKARALKCFEEGQIPLKISIIKTSADIYLALSIHHALYDGISLELVFHDVETFYKSRKQEKRPSYSILLEHVFAIHNPKMELFWSVYLKNCRPKLLALDDALSKIKLVKRSVIHPKMAQAVSRSLEISLQALVQACFAKLMMEILQQDDIIFGTIQGGRAFAPEAQHIIGPCMNTVPMRVAIREHTTLQDLAQKLHDDNIEMVDFIHAPLKTIQGLVGKGPLFETLFVYQTIGESTGGPELWHAVQEDSSVEFPLAVECQISANTIQWTVAMDPSYTDGIDHLTTRLDEILADILKDSNVVVFESGHPIFSPSRSSKIEPVPQAQGSHNKLVLPRIFDVVSTVTKVERAQIQLNTSLFALGMDSIMAISISRHLKNIGLVISVGELLRNASIEAMQEVILSRSRKAPNTGENLTQHDVPLEFSFAPSETDLAHVAERLNLRSENIQQILPATAAQVYFLSAWQDTAGGRFMSNFTFNLTTSGSKERLTSRWLAMVDELEILRTAFCTSKDGSLLLQCLLSSGQSELITFEAKCSTIPTAITEFFESEKFGVPDLSQPPASLTLITTSAGSQAVVLSIHHALYDATSLDMLLDNLQGAEITRELSYSTFSDQVVKKSVATREFWRSYLHGLKPCHLHAIAPSNIVESIELAATNVALSDHYSKSPARSASILDRASSKLGVTSQALLMVAIAKVISKTWRLNDLTLGMYASGRSLDMTGVDKVCGPTVNIIPVRFDDVPTTDSIDLAQKTHTTIIDLNGFMQQCSVSDIYDVLNWNSEIYGGLIDISVNILPRQSREHSPTSLELNSELTESEKFDSEQIAKIRDRYARGFSSTIDGYRGLRALKPVLDVEVEIQDEQVALGVFCNRDILTEDQADDLMNAIWHEIEGHHL